MRASARLVAEATRAGPTRLVEVSASAPFAVRETPDGVFLVGSAQGLVGSDELELDLVVGDGASLTLRTAAASIAYRELVRSVVGNRTHRCGRIAYLAPRAPHRDLALSPVGHGPRRARPHRGARLDRRVCTRSRWRRAR